MNDSGSKRLGKIRPLSFAGHSAITEPYRLRRTITIRMLIVSILVIVRGLTAVFASDLFMGSDIFNSWPSAIDNYPGSVILARGALVIICGLGYFISLWANRYLLEWSLVCMVLGCAVLWSDIELYFIAEIASITTLSMALMSMRIIIVGILISNYLDIRR